MYNPPTKLLNPNTLPIKKQPVLKATQSFMEKYKYEIIKWMSNLTPLQRASVMIIRDESFLRLLKDMIAKGKYEQMAYYLESTEAKIYSRDIFRYKERGGYALAQIKHAESEILRHIIVLRETGEITFSRFFVDKYEVLLEHISVLTSDMVFTFHQQGELALRNSVWFREREFHSTCEWLVYAFQNEILKHFLQGKEPKLYDPLVKAYKVYEFIAPKLRANYFTLERIKKMYKDERIENNEEGKKHKQLNVRKIHELSEEKNEQEIIDDVFFDKIIKHGDPSYFVYLDIIRVMITEEYIDYTFDQLHDVEKEIKTKPVKKHRNKKKKANKKEKEEGKEEELRVLKDTDDTMTETTSHTKQPEPKIEVPTQPKKKYKEKKEKVVSKTQIHYQQQHKTQKQDQQINISSKPQPQPLEKKHRRKRPAKQVNQMINNHIKEYIDEFSNSSNKLLALRRIVFNRLQTTITSILNSEKLFFSSSLRLFGSCALGLSTEQSDIDMVLMLDTHDNLDLIVLEILHKKFEEMKWIVSNKLINCAVPIVKLDVDLGVQYEVGTKEYNILSTKLRKETPLFQVDLSIETQGSLNLNQGIKTTEYTLTILEQHKNMRSIILFLKIFIKARRLDLTFNGGINSYVLFLLVYAFLKHHNYLDSAEIYTPILELLHYYSSSFKIRSMIIDLKRQKPFHQTMPILEKLTIVDPLSQHERYINTNSSQIAKIFSLFKELYSQLVQYKQMVNTSEQLTEARKKVLYNTLKNNFDQLMADVIF